MKAASRLTLVFAVLIGLFVLGGAVTVGTLMTFDTPGLPAVAAVALAAGLLAAVVTYYMARAVGLDGDEEEGERMPVEISLPETARSPLRVKAQPVAGLPVANLPAPYLAAVLKGLQANRAAWKGEWKEL
jgi:hypothetical protein